MTDAALNVVPPARAHELAREQKPGAKALQVIAAAPARYINLLLLLRLLCELTATTLVALVTAEAVGGDRDWLAALITAGSMTVISFVGVGVAPRTMGRQHAHNVARFVAPPV